MAIEVKFQRVAPDDPNRCQATHASQQCPFRAIGTYNVQLSKWDGPSYCARHGGTGNAHQAKIEEKRLYLVAKWEERIGRQADHPKIKSLASEIGIIRMTLEAKLNGIKTDQELVMAASGLVSLTNSVKDMLKTWQHIEERSGQVIDRAKMSIFVHQLIRILTTYIDDADILQMIGEDINETIDNLMKPLDAAAEKEARRYQ